MKQGWHYIFAGCAAAVVLAVATIAFGGSIEASTPRFGKFARPDFNRVDNAPALDLARGWRLSEIDDFTALAADEQICREALDAVGASWVEAPARTSSSGCGFDAGVRVWRTLSTFNAGSVMTCPMAARIYLWEIDVVAPAAQKHLGTTIEEMALLGTYSCRKVAGTSHLSKHAFGEAIDIAGFKTADGRKITVLKSYRADTPEGRFLRDIRRGACGLFDVTLGPDFDRAHADHFHLDIGGGYSCR